MRARGMSWGRLPLFVWAILTYSVLIIFAMPVIAAAVTMLLTDRHFGTHFFDPANGGSPLLWQNLFWFFGHPEVYIMVLPGFGLVSEILPVFARKPIFGYKAIAASTVAIAFLGFLTWAHHMFTAPMPEAILVFVMLSSFLIAVPTGVKMLNWIATLWRGTIEFKTPLLFCAGFIALFLIGGISGVFLAMFPVDWQLNETYFVVAHLHFVLMGGSVFTIFAAIYYWFPKITGRMLSERLGKLSFCLMFVGILVTFLIQHVIGLDGMPRRVYEYDNVGHLALYNQISTVGSFILGRRRARDDRQRRAQPQGRRRRRDPIPWKANTLEWFTTSPPPANNFDMVPLVRSAEPMKDIRREIERRSTGATASGRARPSPPGPRRSGSRWPRRPQATARRDRDSRISASPRARASCSSDYVELTKPKVQSLLLLTTIATMYVAGDPSPLLVALTCLGGYLSAGGAGAVNHWFDRDIDAHMARTADAADPLPGACCPRAALSFGCTLAALSLLELSLTVNPLAAGLSFAGFLGYVFVYTVWLKRRTPQNIVIGGAAGAVPPLVGWAAVTGSCQRHGGDPVLHRVLLDAAPLLGAVAADEGRVREGRRADAPGRARRGRDAPADPAVLGAAVRGHPAAVLRRRIRRDLPRRLARARPRLHRRRRAAVPPRRPALGAAAVPVLARLPRAAVLRDGRRCPPVGAREVFFPPMMTRRLARKNIRTGLIVGGDLHVHVRHHVRRRGGVRLVSPLDPEVPPVGEEIHLPGPSVLPVLTAVGITLLLVGVTTFIELTVVGGLLTLGCVVALDQRHAPRNRRAPARLTSAACGGRARLPAAARDACRPLSASGSPSPHLRRLPAPGRSLRPRSSSARRRERRGCPTVSPCSRTIRWRKPPRTIAAAASSSDQSGAANTTSRVRWSATSSRSGSCPGAERAQDVALGDDPRPVPVGIDHDGRTDLRSRHQPRDGAQGVARPHRQDGRDSCLREPAWPLLSRVSLMANAGSEIFATIGSI